MIGISNSQRSSPLRLAEKAAPATLAQPRAAKDRFAPAKGRPVLDLASGRGNEKPAPPVGAGKDIIAAPQAALDEQPGPGPEAGPEGDGALAPELQGQLPPELQGQLPPELQGALGPQAVTAPKPGTDIVEQAEAEQLKNMSKEQKAQYLLEKAVQKQNQAAQLLSSLQKAQHDAIMAIIQKIG